MFLEGDPLYPLKTALRGSVAFQDDEQMAKDVHSFYLGELAFMSPDVATDNILRRGDFAEEHIAARGDR